MKNKIPVRFIFFSRDKGQRYEEILWHARKLFLAKEISIHSQVKGFTRAILEPGFDHRIILVLAGSAKDLDLILPFRDFFEDRALILILPDSQKDTVDKALSLYLRYIDYVQNDPLDVSLVIKKMLKRFRDKPVKDI